MPELCMMAQGHLPKAFCLSAACTFQQVWCHSFCHNTWTSLYCRTTASADRPCLTAVQEASQVKEKVVTATQSMITWHLRSGWSAFRVKCMSSRAGLHSSTCSNQAERHRIAAVQRALGLRRTDPFWRRFVRHI